MNKYLIKHYPKTIAIFGSLVRNKLWPKQEFRVRILKYPNSDLLTDIREFVNIPNKQRFSTKGICLDYSQSVDLYNKLGEAIAFHEEHMFKELTNESKTQEVTTNVEKDSQEDQRD